MYVVALVFLISRAFAPVLADYEVVTAINVGGEAHVDSFGIYYSKDINVQGDARYCDRYWSVSGLMSPKDEYIYKSYRQNFKNYDLELTDDGNYLLILKFLECENDYQHDLSVKLNGRHTVVKSLDISDNVGVGAALDVYVPFRICYGQMHLNYEISQIFGNNLRVEFTDVTGGGTVASGLVMLKGDFDTIPEAIWPTKMEFNMDTIECAAVGTNQNQAPNNQFRGNSRYNRPIVLNFYNSSVNFGFLMDHGFNESAIEFLKNLTANETQISNLI